MVYLVAEIPGILEFETKEAAENFIASHHGIRSKILDVKPVGMKWDEYKKGLQDAKEYQEFRINSLNECGWTLKLIGAKFDKAVEDEMKPGEHHNEFFIRFLGALCAINDRMNAEVDYTLCAACGGRSCEKCKGTEIKSPYPERNAMVA